MAIKVITVSPRVYGKYPAKLAHAVYLSAASTCSVPISSDSSNCN